jgi:hypothetical protein
LEDEEEYGKMKRNMGRWGGIWEDEKKPPNLPWMKALERKLKY